MARIKLKYVNAFANRGRKDKRVRYYFRRRAGKAMPLPGLPGSEEFMAAYAAALAGLPHVEIGASRTLPGTINALVVNYYGSDDWQKLAADTKKNRGRVIERFRAEHGDKRVALLQREHILGMLAAIERPSAKRHWLKAIRGLLRAAVPSMRRDDPTEGIAGIKMPKGHHTWTDEEIAQYRAYWPLGTQQRLVMEFALETAWRRGEVVRFGPHPELARILAATPSAITPTFLMTAFGKPFTSAGFGKWFRECCDEAGLPKECAAHGLRKAACRRLAEAGCSANVIASISGHTSLREVERYTKAADQERMARLGNGGAGERWTNKNWQRRIARCQFRENYMRDQRPKLRFQVPAGKGTGGSNKRQIAPQTKRVDNRSYPLSPGMFRRVDRRRGRMTIHSTAMFYDAQALINRFGESR